MRRLLPPLRARRAAAGGTPAAPAKATSEAGATAVVSETTAATGAGTPTAAGGTPVAPAKATSEAGATAVVSETTAATAAGTPSAAGGTPVAPAKATSAAGATAVVSETTAATGAGTPSTTGGTPAAPARATSAAGATAVVSETTAASAAGTPPPAHGTPVLPATPVAQTSVPPPVSTRVPRQVTADGTQASFYSYTVLPGDSWGTVAGRTGVAIDDLKAANPQALRSTGWLMLGEVLAIPILPQPDWPRTTIVVVTVAPGESWSGIAAKYTVSPTLLWAVNPSLRRPGKVLITGDQMVIPPAPPV